MLIAATTFVELFDCDILADLVEYFDELGLDADAKTSATTIFWPAAMDASRCATAKLRLADAGTPSTACPFNP